MEGAKRRVSMGQCAASTPGLFKRHQIGRDVDRPSTGHVMNHPLAGPPRRRRSSAVERVISIAAVAVVQRVGDNDRWQVLARRAGAVGCHACVDGSFVYLYRRSGEPPRTTSQGNRCNVELWNASATGLEGLGRTIASCGVERLREYLTQNC